MHSITKLPLTENVLDLLELDDYFCIERPDIGSLDNIRKELRKDTRDHWEKIAPGCYEFHSVNQGRLDARNAAARFCIGSASNMFDLSQTRTINKIFDLSLFILSHPRTFRPRIRHYTDTILNPRCTFSQKQGSLLQLACRHITAC